MKVMADTLVALACSGEEVLQTVRADREQGLSYADQERPGVGDQRNPGDMADIKKPLSLKEGH